MKVLSAILLMGGLSQVQAQGLGTLSYSTNIGNFTLGTQPHNTEDLDDLVSALLSEHSGLNVTSVKLTGPQHECAKRFSGGLSLVPDQDLFFDSGVVLATGFPRFIANQDGGHEQTCFSPSSTGGDPYLTDVVGISTYDACVLEISFVPEPYLLSLKFNYAFGSDEYLEWVNSQFNDAFALLLNGENIAIVPGTNDTVVSIHNINKWKNSEYYVDNDPDVFGIDNVPYKFFEADGFTKKLSATGPLIPDVENTLSFRIADTADCVWDSWVMVEAGTLRGSVEPPCFSLTGGCQGDPHFIMWSGEKFDFHGVCDLVLLENPAFQLGKGMDIHVRTKKTRRWSYISSAAIRIGEDIFELSSTGYWLNGKKNAGLEAGIGGHPIKFSQLNEKHKQVQYEIEINQKESIVLKTFTDMIRVDVKTATGESFEDSFGLMGSYGSNSERIGRDHTTVITDVDEFGKEWQVRPDESNLFHSVEGPQAPEQCKMPALSTSRRRLGEQKVSMEDAELACARLSGNDRDMCIFDVLAIDDADVAGAY